MAFDRPIAEDICEHHILRKNCKQCPQVEPVKSPSPMFVVRNAVVEAMDAIVGYKNYIDPETGKRPDGRAMFLLLLAMAKHCWAAEGNVWPGNTSLAKSTGMADSYIRVLKHAAVQAGIIVDLEKQQLKTRTDMYLMSVDLIQDFVERAVLPVPESLKGFKPDPKGDALEEALMYVAEDLLGIGGEETGDETPPLSDGDEESKLTPPPSDAPPSAAEELTPPLGFVTPPLGDA
ncbi:MAG: hypothetical protein ABR920_09825 [Terriglobales bacterium]